MSSKKKTGPQPSDKWIPWYFVAFYVVLTLTLAPMVYMAVHTMPGVVTKNAYEKGLAYNQAIAAGEAEKNLGWQGDLAVEPDTEGKAAISFDLHDATGQAVAAEQVHLWAVRPVQGGMDRETAMESIGAGRYRAVLDLPVRGVWDMRVSATLGDKNFQSEKRIVIP